MASVSLAMVSEHRAGSRWPGVAWHPATCGAGPAGRPASWSFSSPGRLALRGVLVESLVDRETTGCSRKERRNAGLCWELEETGLSEAVAGFHESGLLFGEFTVLHENVGLESGCGCSVPSGGWCRRRLPTGALTRCLVGSAFSLPFFFPNVGL